MTIYLPKHPLVRGFGQLLGLCDCATGDELKSKEVALLPSQIILLGGTLLI